MAATGDSQLTHDDLEEIGKRPAWIDAERALEEIVSAVAEYHVDAAKPVPSFSEQKRELETLLAAAKDAHGAAKKVETAANETSLAALDRIADARYATGKRRHFDDPFRTQDCLRTLVSAAEGVCQDVELTLRHLETVPEAKGGRPSLVTIRDLAIKLAATWIEHTGKRPTAKQRTNERVDRPWGFRDLIDTVFERLGIEDSAEWAARTAVGRKPPKNPSI
jgi:hypothetical protein